MSRARTAGLLLSAALGLAPSLRADEATVALTGAKVHLGTGEVAEGLTVVLRGRRIAAVGPNPRLPADATRIDLRGQHLYPGLIDMDTVLGLVEIGSVRGSTDVEEVGALNPNLRAEAAVNPDSELIPVARTGGVLLSLVSARSGLVPGCSALIQLDGWTYEEMTVRAPAFLHVRWPSLAIDRTGKGEDAPDEQRLRLEAQLRGLQEMLAQARAYWAARAAPGGSRPQPGDVQWESLRPVLEGLVPVAIHAPALRELHSALRWAERENLRVVVVGCPDAWRIADELARRDIPVILAPVHDLPRRDWEPVEVPFEAPAKLHAAGVRLAFSSGGDGFAAANARNLRLEAAQAVAYGLPAAAAERALTLGAAQIAGAGERLGSLAEGKDATLFVASGDILEVPTRVTRAWIAGREIDLGDRQLRLYERYRARPRRD